MNFSTSSFVQNRISTNAVPHQRRAGLFSGRNSLPNCNLNVQFGPGHSGKPPEGFLKSQVPEILMINRYYGLIPKKFVINQRSEIHSSKFSTNANYQKIRTKSASISAQDRKNCNYQSSEELSNKYKAFESSRNLNQSPPTKDVELVAKRMAVERGKRWRSAGRNAISLSDSEALSSRTPEVQKIIKIDLNNLRWAEEEVPIESNLQEIDEKFKKLESNDPISASSSAVEVNNGGEKSEKVILKSAKARRGTLRKTVSFDDEILTQPEEKPEEPKEKLNSPLPVPLPSSEIHPKRESRPSTASKVTLSSLIHTVKPWTAPPQPGGTVLSAEQKRFKFRKSLRSASLDSNSYGGGESDLEFENGSEIWAAHERRNSLHVQAAPEVMTLMSQLSPHAPIDDGGIDVQPETRKPLGEIEIPIEASEKPDEIKVEEKVDIEKSPEKPPVVPIIMKRPPLRKANSISCENELIDKNRAKVPTLSKPERPRTSKARADIQNNRPVTATTTTTSPGSPVKKAPESKNRKLLIKKALIEINNSGKSLVRKPFLRPRTAPAREKKRGGDGEVVNKGRQPFKVSIPCLQPTVPVPAQARISSNCPPGKTLTNPLSSLQKKENLQEQGQIVHKAMDKEVEECYKPPGEISEALRKRGLFARKTFSLDEGLLYSERGDMSGFRDVTSNIESSKKREDCLKVYEQMLKNGCSIKLETIFRGLLTPSEYREFVQSKEDARKRPNIKSSERNEVIQEQSEEKESEIQKESNET